MMLGTYYTSYASHFTGNGGATWSDATHAATIPRIAFSWRPSPDMAWRLAAGGSIAPPYIALLSSPGTTPVLNPAGAAQGYFINANNGQIAPEKAFGYDLGLDTRLRPSLLFSSDLYLTNVNNMFLTETSQQGTYTSTTGNSAGIPLPLYVTQTGNLGNARYEGIEFQFDDAPRPASATNCKVRCSGHSCTISRRASTVRPRAEHDQPRHHPEHQLSGER